MPVMRVEGDEPLNPDLKGLESGALEPSRKGHVVLMVMSCRVGSHVVWPLRSPAVMAITQHPGSP
jgi:hypothetical protein